MVAAVQADDRDEVARLHAAIGADPACDAAIRDWAGVYLARQYYRDAVDPELSPEARRAALEASLELETHWRTLAELGRVEWTEENYAAAASFLRQALTEVAEGNPEHAASPEEIARLRDIYTDALALSDTVVAAADDELFRQNYRGFVVEETPLPVTFEFDSSRFDAQGRQYADRLLQHVLTHNPPRIELDGHTDPQGGEAYNYALSVARAEALRRHLIEGGYQGEIVVRGFGESQLPAAPEGVAEGSEEHFRIARRVTFRAG